MKDLMTSNVYDTSEVFIVMGTCLPKMQPKAFEELKKISDNIFEICLEKDHINMAITKLAGMTARNKIKHIIFASVDKSPHCTQLHYASKELSKIINMPEIKMTSYVAVNNELIEIPDEVISLSKNLSELKNKIIK